MEELAKSLWVQLGGFGALIAMLIYMHRQNRDDIKELRSQLAVKDGEKAALVDKFITVGTERAVATTQAMMANAAAMEKVDDRLLAIEGKVDRLTSKAGA